MVWEYECAFPKLHKEFVEGLYRLLNVLINYHKFGDTDSMPHFTKEEGVEALLELFSSNLTRLSLLT